jgi:predicted MPP superfamily phosphohydrolase
MLLRRFLPDLIVGSLALAVCARAWMRTRGWRRFLILAALTLLGAGLCVTLLQSAGQASGYRLLMVSGLAFASAASIVWAFGVHLVERRVNRDRRKILTLASHAVIAAPVAALGFGILSGRKEFRVETVDLPVPDLAPDLDGLRFAQLSDIHLSPFLSRADLAWCVDMANEHKPHVGLVTGDLVTGIHDSIGDCLDELRRLKADAGVFGCMGNHEGYLEAEAYTAEQAARRGIRFLRRQQTSLPFGAARLNLAGVDHQWEKPRYLRGAEGLVRAGELNILLSHNPDVFPVAAKQGWDVTFSGHMHGGQINLELGRARLNFMQLVTPYVQGLYTEGKSSIYVSRGIGTVGMPARVGAPPEVGIIRLRRA